MAEPSGNDLCAVVDDSMADVTFEQAPDGNGDRKYGLCFLVSPCCTTTAGELEAKKVEAQRELVRARAEFPEDQNAELIALIDAGEAGYRGTP